MVHLPLSKDLKIHNYTIHFTFLINRPPPPPEEGGMDFTRSFVCQHHFSPAPRHSVAERREGTFVEEKSCTEQLCSKFSHHPSPPRPSERSEQYEFVNIVFKRFRFFFHPHQPLHQPPADSPAPLPPTRFALLCFPRRKFR